MKIKISFESEVSYFDASQIQPFLEEVFNSEATVVEDEEEENEEEESEEEKTDN
jgi:hypothetical protein